MWNALSYLLLQRAAKTHRKTPVRSLLLHPCFSPNKIRITSADALHTSLAPHKIHSARLWGNKYAPKDACGWLQALARPVANQSVSNKGTTRQVFFQQQQQPKETSAKRGEGKKDLADRFIN